jgi:hypothetical protein
MKDYKKNFASPYFSLSGIVFIEAERACQNYTYHSTAAQKANSSRMTGRHVNIQYAVIFMADAAYCIST